MTGNGLDCRIDFEPVGRRVDVAAGTTLREAARRAGIGLATVCGGEGTCGHCRVVLMEGEVSPVAEAERRYLSQFELAAGQRLACRTEVYGPVKVHVPKGSLVTEQRLQLNGQARQLGLAPAVRAYEVQAAPPTLDDLRADLERVASALEGDYGLRRLRAEPATVRALSPLARQADWRLTAYVRGAEIVGVAPAGRRPTGLAVDLGTTKIAGYLVDLESGEDLASAGLMNPQIGYGEDVISRLAHAGRHPHGAADLARVLREALDGLAGSLAEQAGVAREQIVDACIVGNTAMTHLLLALPVQQLALAPFVAATRDAVDVRAQDMDLSLAPGAYVHVLPCIGGFVGADHVAMILATDLDRRTGQGAALGVDIGTNTEIAIYKPGLSCLISASCASGPAFEGAHIRDGMRAASGAIESVRLTASGPEIKTIAGAAPVGLCGSGIVDAVAELVRGGLVNKRGRLQAHMPGVSHGEHGPEFVLVPAAATGHGRDIRITQHDINEIQLAKAAVATGIDTLLAATATAPEDFEDVIIAGAFGSYLSLESAIDIGLLPRLPRARYRQVGNAAGVGARAALLSVQERQRARRIARATSYIELTTYPGFSRLFAQAIQFAPLPVAAG
jgi:uncharacterized 2Fe-2S/4Fe-4S cluster protein (DUF4445 family)